MLHDDGCVLTFVFSKCEEWALSVPAQRIDNFTAQKILSIPTARILLRFSGPEQNPIHRATAGENIARQKHKTFTHTNQRNFKSMA